MDAGARVVNVRELGSFFTVWIPYEYGSQNERRVMLVVDGSEDDAYSTIAGRMRRNRSILEFLLGGAAKPRHRVPVERAVHDA